MVMTLRFFANFVAYPAVQEAASHIDGDADQEMFELVSIRDLGIDGMLGEEVTDATGPRLADLRQAGDERHRQAVRGEPLDERGWAVTSWVDGAAAGDGRKRDAVARVVPAEGSARPGVIAHLQGRVGEHERQARRYAVALEEYTRAASSRGAQVS